MADVAEIDEGAPKKASKLPMILGLCLALVGGGGGFFAAWSNMILPSGEAVETIPESDDATTFPKVAFVEIPTLTIGIDNGGGQRFLRFGAQLEVPDVHKAEVEQMMPRIVDVLNSYLRAVRPSDLEANTVLPVLRSQMLHRLKVILGQSKVNDVLVMEFIIN